MKDPWKYLAFPAAAVAGYVLAMTQLAVFVQESIGLSQYISEMAVVAVSGLIAGFIVDEMVPAYLEKIRSGAGDMDGDIGGDMGGGDDFDFE